MKSLFTEDIKKLIILRGVAGSGKTTLGKILFSVFGIFGLTRWGEADFYYTDENGQFHFDPSKIKEAHKHCFEIFQKAIEDGAKTIILSNTFIKEWEFATYIEAAKLHGYTVFSLIVENRHGSESVHEVPETTVDRMREDMQISL